MIAALALASLATLALSPVQDPALLEIPSEEVFRSVVRDLRAAAGAGDLTPFRGEELEPGVHAVTRPLGRLLPRSGESPTHPRLGGSVSVSSGADTGAFPIVQLRNAPPAQLEALDAGFAELASWLRAEAGDWPVEAWESTDASYSERTVRAQAFPFEESPHLEIALVHIELGSGADHRLSSSIFLRARAPQPHRGYELSSLGKREAAEVGSGLRALLDVAHRLDLGPDARVVRIGHTPVSDQQGNDVAHAISGLARDDPTLVVFVTEDGRMLFDYHPHAPAEIDHAAEEAMSRPGFPSEPHFRRVVRNIMGSAFTDYTALLGPRIYSYIHRPVEPLGTRLPRDGRDPAQEELATQGTVFTHSSMSQGDYPILERRGVDRATHRDLLEGFEELRRWYLEETVNWEVEETVAEQHEDERITSRVRELTAQPTPQAVSDFVRLTLNESFSRAEDGTEAADVRITILSIASKPLTGLTRSWLEAYGRGGTAYKAGELLVEWMAERGFPEETEIIWIGERDVTWALRGERDQLLMDLQHGGTTPLLLRHLGRVERHDFIADPARLPDLPELHTRLLDGRLSPAGYATYLRTAEWTELTTFARRLAAERERGFRPLLGEEMTPDGRVTLVEGPLGPDAGSDYQWVRPLGDQIAFELVLGRSTTPEDAERLHLTLVGKVRAELAALPELRTKVSVATDAFGSNDLALGRMLHKPPGQQVVVSIRLHAPEVARVLRQRLAASFEPLDSSAGDPVTSGWGRLRHRATGYEIEALLRDGVPDGPGRRVDPETGQVVVAHFRGLAPSGRAVVFDPTNELHVRGRLADDRLLERDDLPAWKGPEDDAPYHSLDRLEHGPIVLARGASGASEASGQHTVTIPGLGTYTGAFLDGIAEGKGRLEREDGVVQLIVCRSGVAVPVRTLAWPGSERLAYVRRHGTALLPPGDCISGDTAGGQVEVLLDRDSRGRPILYRGAYQAGQMHGQGTYEHFWLEETGNFTNGKRHGVFDVTYKKEDGSVESKTQMHFIHGVHDASWGLEPAAPEPTATADDFGAYTFQPLRPAARATYTCVSCNGTGRYDDLGAWSFGGPSRSFMPGDRHYGSWIWKGYENEDYEAPRVAHGVCSNCGGSGVIRY